MVCWNVVKVVVKVVLDVFIGYKMDFVVFVFYEEGKFNYLFVVMGGGSVIGDVVVVFDLIFECMYMV